MFAPVVSGNSLSSPFQVSVNQQAVPASGGGLPNSASRQLAAGQPQTYQVTVKNTGTAPETFFPDARLPGSTPFTLGAISGATDNLPENDNVPVYLVPTNSTQFQAQATTTGSTPLLFESQFVGGDPDLASTIGTTASLSFTDNPVATGEWDVLPVEYGTFGTTGPPSESVTTSASVVTSPFDPRSARLPATWRQTARTRRRASTRSSRSPSLRARLRRFRSRSRRAERRARRSPGRSTSTTWRTSSSARSRTHS